MRKYFGIFLGGLCFCALLCFGYVFALDNSSSPEISSDNRSSIEDDLSSGTPSGNAPQRAPVPSGGYVLHAYPNFKSIMPYGAYYYFYAHYEEEDGIWNPVKSFWSVSGYEYENEEDGDYGFTPPWVLPVGSYTVSATSAESDFPGSGSKSFDIIDIKSISGGDPVVVSTVDSAYLLGDAQTILIEPGASGTTTLTANIDPEGGSWGTNTLEWLGLPSDQFPDSPQAEGTGVSISNSALEQGSSHDITVRISGSSCKRLIRVKKPHPRVDSITAASAADTKTVKVASGDSLSAENAFYVLQGTAFTLTANPWPSSYVFPSNTPSWSAPSAFSSHVVGGHFMLGIPKTPQIEVRSTLPAGTYDIGATHNEGRSIRIVVANQLVKSISGGGKTSDLDPDETITESETIYLPQGTPLTLTAAPDPTTSSFPSGKPTWTADGLTSHLSATTGTSITINSQAPVGTYLVKASHNNTKVIKVVIAEIFVASISDGDKTSTKETADSITENETIYILQGTELTLTAAPDPSTAEFPENMPTWSGIDSSYFSLDDINKSITINDQAPSGEYIISAACNNVKLIKVVIIPIEVKEISGKGKVSEKGPGETLTDEETIFVPEGASAFTLKATPTAGEFPEDAPVWSGIPLVHLDLPTGATEASGETITVKDTIPAGTYTVTASHGESTKCILLKVSDVNITISATDLDGNVAENADGVKIAYVHWNIDNDNDSTDGDTKHPGGDYKENSDVTGEDDFKILTFELLPLEEEGIVQLTLGAGGRLWTSPIGGTLLVDSGGSISWDLSVEEDYYEYYIMRLGLYMEGVAAGDCKLTAKYIYGGETISEDIVNYKFIAANCGRQPTVSEKYFQTAAFPYGFPSLGGFGCEWSITANQSNTYNCIAYSVGITNQWFNYTNCGAPDNYTLPTEAQIKAFYLNHGYIPCTEAEAEVYYYSDFHAAIKKGCSCGDGKWTMLESKCGGSFQIEHRKEALSEYGTILYYFKKAPTP